jgi:hypothetical protein
MADTEIPDCPRPRDNTKPPYVSSLDRLLKQTSDQALLTPPHSRLSWCHIQKQRRRCHRETVCGILNRILCPRAVVSNGREEGSREQESKGPKGSSGRKPSAGFGDPPLYLSLSLNLAAEPRGLCLCLGLGCDVSCHTPDRRGPRSLAASQGPGGDLGLTACGVLLFSFRCPRFC